MKSLSLLILIFFGVTGQDAWGAQTIKSLSFTAGAGTDTLEIRASGPVEYEKQQNAEDRQIVLELKDATLSRTALRNLDTSSFNSSVSLVSPYQVEGTTNARIVISLRDNVDPQIVQEGNSLKVLIPNQSNVGAEAPTPNAAPSENRDAFGAAPTPATPTGTNLDAFTEARDSKRFNGRKITLQVRDAEIGDVLRLIGEASGFNMVISEEVKGLITLSLVDVPWDQALDVVLHTKGLGAERNNNILRILTLASLTSEKQSELRAKRAVEANAPRVTKVFQVSYAKPSELKTILTTFGNGSGAAVGGSSSGSGGMDSSVPVASIQVDERTNSVIVEDMPDNIEKMRKLIEILDTQTPQVMIEAKVVEATEGFTKSLGGSLGLGNAGTRADSSQFLSSFAGGNPIDLLIGNGTGVSTFPDGAAFSNATSAPASGAFGLSPSISFIPGVNRLNALISMGESENQLKVVSSPKTVVMNKQKTNIVQSTPVLVPTMSLVNNVPVVSPVIQQAKLDFTVTPTVTNDGNVILELSLSRDVPTKVGNNQAGVAMRNISTSVVVESGSTLVIGGIYTVSTDSASGGFPFLRKIPIIGAFFGNETETINRSELFFFVTPRIINEKEAGISG